MLAERAAIDYCYARQEMVYGRSDTCLCLIVVCVSCHRTVQRRHANRHRYARPSIFANHSTTSITSLNVLTCNLYEV